MTPDQQHTPLALIVDDDAVNRLMARAALESAGWSVEEAENGREALAAFQQLHPDVVLLDIMMPEMDGFAACAALRKLPEGEHTPILIMTGLDDYGSITTGLRCRRHRLSDQTAERTVAHASRPIHCTVELESCKSCRPAEQA